MQILARTADGDADEKGRPSRGMKGIVEYKVTETTQCSHWNEVAAR